MIIPRTSWLSVGISLAVAVVVLAAFASGSISGPTSAWMGAVVIAMLGVALLALRAGRPTRSVAHVLYDAEQHKELGR
jgi:hypothetical protein